MRLFISRELSADSPFYETFRDLDVEIQAESLVAFALMPFADLPFSDWIFFTSRQSVLFFFQGLKTAAIPFPVGTKLAVMGEGTAKALRECGYAPDFIGNGEPQMVGESMGLLAKGETILFPRALQSRETIQKAIGEWAIGIDLVVYNNQPRIDLPAITADALVFTSPLNVEAYFLQQKATAKSIFFAIGATTRQALQDKNIDTIWVPATPSEESLAQLCRSVLLGH